MRSSVLLLLFLLPWKASAVGPSWPLTDMPRFWILGEGNGHFSVDGFYFHTKENYDGDGSLDQPAVMEHVRYGNMRFHTGFGFTPTISLYAQADLRSVFMVNSKGSNVSDDENYGFGDAFVAARWLMYRSRSTDRVYPTEWEPKTWLALAEGSWVFPMYNEGKPGKPPLGDQSNDFTILGRLAWYANEWLAFSGNAGYTHRTSGYTATVPWGLRVDFHFLQYRSFRLWAELQANERTNNAGIRFNPSQPDPIQSGSLLFKSESPALRVATLGAGYLISKEWELALGGIFTASGNNAAKGFGGAMGLVWRPYQVPELKYADYRREQLQRLAQEPMSYKKYSVMRYGFQATVVRVSSRGNFLQIGFGQKDGVRVGETFHVFEPDDFSDKVRKPIATAKVAAAREADSFLRVETAYKQKLRVRAGYEVRRVIFEE